jgi:hypothetical protein
MGKLCALCVLLKPIVVMLKNTAKEKSVAKKLKKQIVDEGGECEKCEWYVTGWPDLWCCNKYGVTWLIETKRPKGGVFSARQILVHQQLKAKNVRVRVVNNDSSIRIFMTEFRNTFL